jgi:hypothetical protein
MHLCQKPAMAWHNSVDKSGLRCSGQQHCVPAAPCAVFEHVARYLDAEEMMSALQELGMLEGMRPRQLGVYSSARKQLQPVVMLPYKPKLPNKRKMHSFLHTCFGWPMTFSMKRR